MRNRAPPASGRLTEADCTAAKLGSGIPVAAIGEPVSAVTLDVPQWHAEADGVRAYCSIEGSMAPVDKSPTASPIRFGVALPASWAFRAAHLGGGGNNGTIPRLTGGIMRGGAPLFEQGFATYGSDSGHQAGGRRTSWALNDEAVANLAYMQLKKTHDAAMIIMERAYGERPRFNYFFGNSQGGREALTVAQRYPADYDGISAEVPIVSFSSLMLAPELIRIREKPLANWVTPAKVNAIRGEFMRQCDTLDGLVDGVINNYMACRAIFDVKQGAPNRRPWAARRCPDNVDPNPQDTSAAACLTDGQIATLEMVYSPYVFATPLANGVKSFGMWFPNTDPSGSGLIASTRFRGQEGAAEGAPMHSHLGVVGVTGILMRDLKANPLDYVEGGPLNRRRVELSAILDSTNPDLSAFQKRGGKLIGRHRHERHAGVTRRAGGLLPVGHRQDGPGGGRHVRPVLRAAPGGSRPERQVVRRGWRRQGRGRPADSEHVRSHRPDHGLGRKGHSSRQGRHGDGGRPQPADVLLPGVSEVPERTDRSGKFIRLLGEVARERRVTGACGRLPPRSCANGEGSDDRRSEQTRRDGPAETR